METRPDARGQVPNSPRVPRPVPRLLTFVIAASTFLSCSGGGGGFLVTTGKLIGVYSVTRGDLPGTILVGSDFYGDPNRYEPAIYRVNIDTGKYDRVFEPTARGSEVCLLPTGSELLIFFAFQISILDLVSGAVTNLVDHTQEPRTSLFEAALSPSGKTAVVEALDGSVDPRCERIHKVDVDSGTYSVLASTSCKITGLTFRDETHVLMAESWGRIMELDLEADEIRSIYADPCWRGCPEEESPAYWSVAYLAGENSVLWGNTPWLTRMDLDTLTPRNLLHLGETEGIISDIEVISPETAVLVGRWGILFVRPSDGQVLSGIVDCRDYPDTPGCH